MPPEPLPAQQNSPEISVFLNLPYDEAYRELFLAYIAGLSVFGLTPHAALEDATSTRRLNRICELIENCTYSIHDLSQLEFKSQPRRPRLNMPFELGLAVARDIKSRNKPSWFIFADDLDSLKSSLSDLDGTDVQIHSEKRNVLFTKLMDVFSNPSLQVSVPLMEAVYQSLVNALPKIFEDAGQDEGRETVFGTAMFRTLCAIAASSVERRRAMAPVLAIGEASKKELPGEVKRRAMTRKRS